ncbi:MAG: hypothetical protein AAF532_06310 [Planctomycetota bacterium]
MAVFPGLLAVAAVLAADGTVEVPGPVTPTSHVSYAPVVAPVGRQAPFDPARFVRTDTATLAPLLDFQNRQGDKQLLVLDSLRTDERPAGLTLGAQVRGSLLVAETNSANRFPYLGRFPTAFVGTTATDARLLQANVGVVAKAERWAGGYLEVLFSDVFTFPSSNQGSLQTRQAYVVFGDLEESPFYAFLGKKNVSFGDFGTLSLFTQAVPWHYFAPLAEGAGVGYVDEHFHFVLTGLDGGRGIRVSDSPEIGRMNNFAVNAVGDFPLADDLFLRLGGGYLHGTIYDAGEAEHIDTTLFGPRNPAWDFNGLVRWGDFTVAGEYVQTVEDWPVVGHEVVAWRAEAAYDFVLSDCPSRVYVSFSEGVQGVEDTEWRFNRQLILGVGWRPSPHVLFTAEYVRSTGFAPLINITAPFVSEDDTVQNSLVVGAQIVI